jgi:DNA polymerase
MGRGRQRAVWAGGDALPHADWMVVGDPPDEAQERAGQPFVNEAGLLLDNMLRVLGVSRTPAAPAHTAYLSLVLKCRPALPTTVEAADLARCSQYLRQEVAQVQPKVILAMGRLALQVLLAPSFPQGLTLPLAKLRGQVWRFEGVPVVVTYPPSYLLHQRQDKARAWEDLCLAYRTVSESAAAAGGSPPV